MTLSIKNAEADRLARQLAKRTGQTITQAVVTALRECLSREDRKLDDDRLVEDVLEIARHYSSLPVLDPHSDDDIVGFDPVAR
jgi:antitoxin VapB